MTLATDMTKPPVRETKQPRAVRTYGGSRAHPQPTEHLIRGQKQSHAGVHFCLLVPEQDILDPIKGRTKPSRISSEAKPFLHVGSDLAVALAFG
jgi:hypothetical protein